MFSLLKKKQKNIKCFLSCVTANYENPGKFKRLSGWDYILFTDTNISGGSWDVRKIYFNKSSDNIINSRLMKFQGWKILKQYKIIVWCDSYLRPTIDYNFWNNIVKKTLLSKNGIVQSKHPIRSCPYDECTEVLKCKKDNKENIKKTLKLFKRVGIRKNCGLWENCCFCYNTRNTNVQKLFNTLWKIYMTGIYSKRDQIMYMYAIHMTGISPEQISGENEKIQGFMRQHFVVNCGHGGVNY